MKRVFTFGETMALVTAGSGAWETSASARIGIGGADSNVAIGLSRLGIRASWLGRVGDDALGRRIVRELRAEGVDVYSRLGPGRTGLMVKEKRTPHTSNVAFYRSNSAGSTIAPEDVPLRAIAQADLVHVTGITPALSASARSTVEAVLDAASTSGTMVSFDVNHRASLWSTQSPQGLYRSIVAQSNIVFAGEEEALVVLGDSYRDKNPTALASAIADLGPREVLIKRGARGSVGVVDGEVVVAPAVAVSVVDTVGAGDAYVSGYLAARLRNAAPLERLRLGALVGAFACLHEGDWEGLPRTEDLALLTSDDPVQR